MNFEIDTPPELISELQKQGITPEAFQVIATNALERYNIGFPGRLIILNGACEVTPELLIKALGYSTYFDNNKAEILANEVESLQARVKRLKNRFRAG